LSNVINRLPLFILAELNCKYSKTKIMVFRKGDIFAANERWHNGNEEIEI
jgi:hypothetical protein